MKAFLTSLLAVVLLGALGTVLFQNVFAVDATTAFSGSGADPRDSSVVNRPDFAPRF